MNKSTLKNILQRAYHNKPYYDAMLTDVLKWYDGNSLSEGGVTLEGETQEYSIRINMEPIEYGYSETGCDDPDDPKFCLPELEPVLWAAYGTLQLKSNGSNEHKTLFYVEALGSSDGYAAQRVMCSVAKFLRKTDPLALNRICSLKREDCQWKTYCYV